MNTVDAMKTASALLRTHANMPAYKEAADDLDAAIAREEAQTVEPLVRHTPPPSGELGTFEERVALRAWQASSGEQSSVEGLRTWAGITEREALISAMHMYAAAYPDSKHFRRVAVMLAADALLEAKAWHRGRDAGIAEVARHNAQQVAVPQGWKLVPIALTAVMLDKMTASQAKRCNGETMLPIGRLINLSESKVSEALFEAYRAAIFSAPQPPQAERVPMTKAEVDVLWNSRTADGYARSRYDIVHAIETHHHIGVK